MTDKSAGERVRAAVTSPAAKKFAVAAVAMLVFVTVFYALVQTRGILNAIAYVFVFLFCLTLFPTMILLFGNGVPGSTSIGKLHLVLGAVAFDYHYLVQRENKWEWCPGERGRVYIDGEWHDVEGQENYSILGWRPFGILRYKDDETWADKRVDTKSQRVRGETVADGGGGDEVVERGGWKEVVAPAVSGAGGTWVVDLKRVYTRGIEQIGDIDLIETAEEIIERGQANSSRFSGWKPFVETGGGLLLGVITGYIYLFVS